jgi:hypothetical protein
MIDEPTQSLQDFWNHAYGEDKATEDKVAMVSDLLSNGTLRQATDVIAKTATRSISPTWFIEEMLDRFWGDWFRKFIVPDMDEAYSAMTSNKFGEECGREFFYLPSSDKIVVYPGAFSIIFIWSFSCFHIRRFWPPWTNQQQEEGADPADYSDSFNGAHRVCRPDLRWYRENGFQLKYGDSRDVGYIGTYKRMTGLVDRAISQHALLKVIAACYVPAMTQQVLGRVAAGPWKKIVDRAVDISM